MIATDSFIPHHPQIPTQPSDSGVNLDYLVRCPSGTSHAPDNDEVFSHGPSPPMAVDNNVMTSSSSVESSSSLNTVTELQQPTGLSRSKRSHFSRKDSTPDNKNKADGEFLLRISIEIF